MPVRGSTTIEPIEPIEEHLAKPMRLLLQASAVGDYRLGGQITGACNRDYDPTADPVTWRPCGTCGGSTRLGRARCTVCADAEQAGRTGLYAPLRQLIAAGWPYAVSVP